MILPAMVCCCWIAPPPDGPIAPTRVLRADLAHGRVTVSVEPPQLAPGTRLVLAAELQPVGWFELTARKDDKAVFSRTTPTQAEPTSSLSAWLVAPNTTAQLLERWPYDAPLTAPLDSIGPGAASAWIAAGTHHGLRVGDQWWLRIAGQPVARFDVRAVEPETCFGAVVPLAANVSLRSEQAVELWPTPAQRRRGAGHSAVAYVERAGDVLLVWAAAPRSVACPPEPHLDFYRGGRYLGHGVVEARDELFWYARFTPSATRTRPERGTQSATTSPTATAPASRSTTRPDSGELAPLDDTLPIRVGDLAVIRTQADIAHGRLRLHVFEISSDGALINGGEGDGLAPGRTGSLLRDGQPLGQVELARVQRGYSAVRPIGGADAWSPAPGDEVRFRPPPPRPTLVGRIETVVERTLFTAQLATGARPPLLVPLALRSSDGTTGVGVLLATNGPSACGFAVTLVPDVTLQAGDTLWLDEPDANPTQDR